MDPRRRVLEVAPRRGRFFRAPGRVNLIGDHTDYNEGFVLPAAIQLECVVGVAPSDRLALRSLDGPDPRRFVDAVAQALALDVRAEGVLASSVPLGSGLSSSAALEVAVATALCALAGDARSSQDVALACQRAEHLATGVPSGIMDQLTAAAAVDGHALLIDCRSLETLAIRVPEEIAFVVVHSGVARELAESAYAARRAECERIAGELGVPALRDATIDQVAHEPLARHVVAENARVLDAADALERGDVQRLGELFLESHASLRDDYGVSIPELDTLVERLVAAGALGARLTGAGFGGAVVAVVERARTSDVLAAVADLQAFVAEPSAGAGELPNDGFG